MHIIALGLNHTTAPVQLRERLAYSEDQIRASLARLSCGRMSSPLVEMVILSTCNRIEIYSASNELSFDMLEVFLSETRDTPVEEIRSYLYRFQDMDAVQHLFEVSAGLDSLVVGEPQILGQVTKALELARGQSGAGPILNRLFQSAIHSGKRARTETAISRNPASVSSLAASLAERTVHNISEAQIVILGAGEMAELAVEALRKRGAQKILVVNRTLQRAQTLAWRWDAQVSTFEHLSRALTSADILIASTGAPHMIVSPQTVSETMEQRPDRPLVLIDIAVPRDIDPDVANIPNVKLYDIDTLNGQLEYSLTERMAEVPQVRNILGEELETFGEYLRSLEMLPLIVDLRQKAEAIRQTELEKTLRHLPELTEAERIHVEALTQALVKKLLHAPTNRLRAEAASPHASEYASITRNLFGLSDKQNLSSTAAD